MTDTLQVYKCELCGNIVEVLHAGPGQLVCCGQPMVLYAENTVDAAKEKHVPVMGDGSPGLKVTVGAVPHPMEEKHYIEWIETITDKGVCRKFLKPGEKPEAFFKDVEGLQKTREYCNIHGLWTFQDDK